MVTCQQDSIAVALSLTCCKCSFCSIVTENKKQHRNDLLLIYFDELLKFNNRNFPLRFTKDNSQETMT